MTSQYSTWGGARLGAGRRQEWNLGETKPVRVPIEIAGDVLQYAKLIDGSMPNGLLIADALACELGIEKQHENVTQSSYLLERLDELKAERDRLDFECDRLAAQVGDLSLEIENLKAIDESVTQSRVGGISEKVVAILTQALELKANAGGAIKAEIRQALALLQNQ